MRTSSLWASSRVSYVASSPNVCGSTVIGVRGRTGGARLGQRRARWRQWLAHLFIVGIMPRLICRLEAESFIVDGIVGFFVLCLATECVCVVGVWITAAPVGRRRRRCRAGAGQTLAQRRPPLSPCCQRCCWSLAAGRALWLFGQWSIGRIGSGNWHGHLGSGMGGGHGSHDADLEIYS